MQRHDRPNGVLQPFGLSADFPGARWVAAEGDLELTLGHGEPPPSASPSVFVGVIVGPPEPGRTIDIRDTLGTRLALGEVESHLEALRDDPSALQAATRQALGMVPAPGDWATARVRFDGQEVDFFGVGLGAGRVAARALAGGWVYVHCRHVRLETLAIVPITDLGPYRRGSVRLVDRDG